MVYLIENHLHTHTFDSYRHTYGSSRPSIHPFIHPFARPPTRERRARGRATARERERGDDRSIDRDDAGIVRCVRALERASVVVVDDARGAEGRDDDGC